MRQNDFITAILGSISMVVVAHADALRTVALSGQPAPGTDSGVTLAAFLH